MHDDGLLLLEKMSNLSSENAQIRSFFHKNLLLLPKNKLLHDLRFQ